MRIMPVSGNDMGISARQWLRIRTALAKVSQSAEDDYDRDITSLPVVSVEQGKIEAAMGDDGVGYAGSVKLTLEGDIRYPYGGDEQEVKDGIVADFDDWAWQDNAACRKAVDEAFRDVHGGDRSVTHSARVESLAATSRGTFRVCVVLDIGIESNETMLEYRQRGEEERSRSREE
jgi:hypothetical protein